MNSAELLFAIANNGVLPFWALLVLAPRWRGTRLLVHSMLPVVSFGGLYGACILLGQPGPEGGGFGSLEEVRVLFSRPMILTAGWVHYIVFDLFVGAWIAREAERQNIHHGLVVPCLLITLMLGPLGLLSFALLRAVLRRRSTLDESSSAAAARTPAPPAQN